MHKQNLQTDAHTHACTLQFFRHFDGVVIVYGLKTQHDLPSSVLHMLSD